MQLPRRPPKNPKWGHRGRKRCCAANAGRAISELGYSFKGHIFERAKKNNFWEHFGADTIFAISSIFNLQETPLFSPPQNVLLPKSLPRTSRFFTREKQSFRNRLFFVAL